MGIQLSAVSPRGSVGAAEDPFKKYWWAILGGFILTGAWLCLPILETPVGSAHVDTSKPAANPNAEQSLDSVENPNGAQGSAVDLSMDGAGKRKSKSGESLESMLYQAPPETVGAAAAGAPLGAASGSASLAQQLKNVGDKKNDAGWGEKAQRGFTAPHLGGGGLSGMGSASGGSSASSGGNAFGSSNAQVSYGATRGLKDDGGGEKAVGGLQALRNAAATATAAAASKSNDAARAGTSGTFDGSKGRNGSIGAELGGAAGGTYAAFDAAPANLKGNDPKLDKKEMKEPPGTADVSKATDSNKQMVMMMAMMAVGGLVGGEAGQMIMMMGPMMMQQQAAQAAEARAAEKQKKL